MAQFGPADLRCLWQMQQGELVVQRSAIDAGARAKERGGHRKPATGTNGQDLN